MLEHNAYANVGRLLTKVILISEPALIQFFNLFPSNIFEIQILLEKEAFKIITLKFRDIHYSVTHRCYLNSFWNSKKKEFQNSNFGRKQIENSCWCQFSNKYDFSEKKTTSKPTLFLSKFLVLKIVIDDENLPEHFCCNLSISICKPCNTRSCSFCKKAIELSALFSLSSILGLNT